MQRLAYGNDDMRCAAAAETAAQGTWQPQGGSWRRCLRRLTALRQSMSCRVRAWSTPRSFDSPQTKTHKNCVHLHQQLRPSLASQLYISMGLPVHGIKPLQLTCWEDKQDCRAVGVMTKPQRRSRCSLDRHQFSEHIIAANLCAPVARCASSWCFPRHGSYGSARSDGVLEIWVCPFTKTRGFAERAIRRLLVQPWMGPRPAWIRRRTTRLARS